MKLKGLKAAVRQSMRAVADADQDRSPADVERQLVAFKLNPASFIDAFTQEAYREPINP